MDGLGLDGDRCIRMIPQHPPFSVKEEALPACRETYQKYTMVLKGPSNATDLNVLQGKLTKNLADLYTFETSMSLRDRVTTQNEP